MRFYLAVSTACVGSRNTSSVVTNYRDLEKRFDNAMPDRDGRRRPGVPDKDGSRQPGVKLPSCQGRL